MCFRSSVHLDASHSPFEALASLTRPTPTKDLLLQLHSNFKAFLFEIKKSISTFNCFFEVEFKKSTFNCPGQEMEVRRERTSGGLKQKQQGNVSMALALLALFLLALCPLALSPLALSPLALCLLVLCPLHRKMLL